MITFNNITVWMRDVYASRFEPEGVRSITGMYWRALVVGGAVFVALALLFGLWNFFGVVDTLASLSDTSPPPPAAFSSVALHGVAGGFDARQAQFEAFAAGSSPALPDPSK
jgi:hypothetical protein